ncbi:MAG: sigma-70 family RNA polymerase sigma factor [Bacteroidota bacterium]
MSNRGEKKYSDQELLTGLKAGGIQHEKWVKRLLHQYGGYVFKGIKKFNISKEAAKDAYIDAVTAVSRQIREGKFREDSKLSTYMYRIFSNYCIKQHHKDQRVQPEWSHEIPNLPDSAQNRLQELIVSEKIAQLYHWLDQLGGNCKQILILRDFQQLSPEEIARKIGFKTAQSVSSKRYRCLENLRQLIHSAQDKSLTNSNKKKG